MQTFFFHFKFWNDVNKLCAFLCNVKKTSMCYGYIGRHEVIDLCLLVLQLFIRSSALVVVFQSYLLLLLEEEEEKEEDML